MSEADSGNRQPGGEGLRIGSWFGAAASALGIGACVTIVTLGGTATMDEGGFVASGGPYEIAHPVPEGFWILPVAFIGMFALPVLHAVFASRIKGFALVFATWCAVWTAIGATTLWYGLNPPGGTGLAWGWLIMGTVFVVVGLGSTGLYVSYLRSPQRESPRIPQGRRLPYAVMTVAALAAGVYAGFEVFGAVVG